MEKKLCFFEVVTTKLKNSLYISLCKVKIFLTSLLSFEHFLSLKVLLEDKKPTNFNLTCFSTNKLMTLFNQLSFWLDLYTIWANW